MADPRVNQLSKVPLFSRCTKRELEFLSSHMDEIDLPAGRTLLTEGKPTDSFFVVITGEVEVATAKGFRKPLGPGDFFGEIGMLDRGNATATVTTRTPVRALVLSHLQFRDAIAANEALALKVIAAMAERLRELTLV